MQHRLSPPLGALPPAPLPKLQPPPAAAGLKSRDRVALGALTSPLRASSAAPLVLFHVGDSRLYRQRGGLLEQLTRDQTMYQQALESGAFENLPPRNLLLQAVGPSARVTPEVRSLVVQAGDVLMLCSDGLHGSVPHGEIEATMAAVTEATLDQACARLIALAKEYGGRDNITVLMALCQNQA